MAYHNMNRNTLKALKRRFTNKDIAILYEVTPATIGAWTAKDSKGNYKRKKLNTRKDYTQTKETTTELIKRAKPSKSRIKRTFNRTNYIEGRKGKVTEFRGGKTMPKNAPAQTIHYEYNFSSFAPELIKAKMYDIVNSNEREEVELTNCFIKLNVEILDYVRNRDDEARNEGQKDIDYVSTPAYIVGEFDEGKGGSIYYPDNMDALIAQAVMLKSNKYGGTSGVILKVIETILVEKHFPLKS